MRILSRVRFAALIACALAEPVSLAAASEAEVLLRTRRFAGSLPGRAVADFWRDLTAAARADPELEAEGALALVHERVIRFYDTPESCVLRAHGYRLAEEAGSGARRWTLAGGAAGSSAGLDRPPATLGDVVRFFPELEKHTTFDPLQSVVPINDLTLREKAYAGASLLLDGEEAALSVVLWYTEPPTRPLAVSVVLRPENPATKAAGLVDVLEQMVLWTEPAGGTRMGIVYRGFCR